MFSLIRRDDFRPDSLLSSAWEPLRQMEEWFNVRPFREFDKEELVTPDLEVKENTGSYVVKADLPGVQEKDLEVTIKKGVLTLAGKREGEERKAEKAEPIPVIVEEAPEVEEAPKEKKPARAKKASAEQGRSEAKEPAAKKTSTKSATTTKKSTTTKSSSKKTDTKKK